MDSISKVFNAITRVPQSTFPKGELILGSQFMKDYLNWRDEYKIPPNISELEVLKEICRSLRLDLVCIQSENSLGKNLMTNRNQCKVAPASRNELFVFWVINGTFQLLMNHIGLMEIARQAAMEAKAIGSKLKQISQNVIEEIKIGVTAGAHGVIIADDIAYQKNTYLAPDFYERYLLPLWQKQVETAKHLDTPIFFHSDGNINRILPMIVEAGFDGLQCIEPAAGMDICEIKQTYGDKLCLMGNIDPSLLIDGQKNEDALQNAVNDLKSKIAPGGGFIFGTCSGLHAGLSPRKVHQMYRML